MKRINLKLLILLMVILILPVFVMAEEADSKTAPSGENVANFGLEKVLMKDIRFTKYSNYLSTGKTAITVNGVIDNGYGRDINAEVELYFYDKNDKVIDVVRTNLKVLAKKKDTCRLLVYEKEVPYSFDDIKTYSLKLIVNDDLDAIADSEKDQYVFENYKVKVKVNTNNKYNVEESFDLRFRKHVDTFVFGIPYRIKYTLEDGSKINKRAVMSNIRVDDDFDLKTEDGYRNLYIGSVDKDNTVKSYKITYDYNAFEDTIKKQDEFVFYIVNNRENKIDGLSFEVEFPDDIEKNEIYFMDEHGTKLENVEYEVEGNKVTGRFDHMINSNVSYAIKVVLKDKYFVHTDKNISNATIMTLLVSIISLAVTILVWLAQKKRDTKGTYNSIYFNDKINSLELGYLFNGDVRDKDIATLLVSLANKGFIEIEKSKKSYKILKVKDYTEDDRVEKVFMRELFQNDDVVTRKELINNVDYMKYNIEFKLQKHKKKNRLFIRPVINYKLIFWGMIALIFALFNINIFLEYQTSAILINVIVGGIGYMVMLYGILYENTKIEKVIYTFVGLMFIVAPIVLTKYMAFIEDDLKLMTYMIGIVSMLVIITITRMMNNRSFYGTRMLNKINAYKEYLIKFKDVDKELKNNKYCFYEVLPYTFVLGISDKWYEKFKDCKMVKPKWYDSDEFDLEEFYQDIKDIYADIFISLKNSEKN